MTKTNSQKRSFFKARQRKGDVTRLVENLGFSQPHISNVLAGRRNNIAILDAAVKIAARRKALV